MSKMGCYTFAKEIFHKVQDKNWMMLQKKLRYWGNRKIMWKRIQNQMLRRCPTVAW